MTHTENLTAEIAQANKVFTAKIIEIKPLKCGSENADWVKATIKTDQYGNFTPPKNWNMYRITALKKNTLEIEFVKFKQ